ncbi:MAG: FAD-dependent oxidoreductase [Alphaproteobacteria bacterium]|nr:FAD-dependent oxidoreductase [Alphaproteobacteria bacterium]
MSARFPLLFSPLQIGTAAIKNRIFFSGHGTRLADGTVNDALIAYHHARAKGGAGLIITEVAGVHPTAYLMGRTLKAFNDDCIPGFRRLAQTCHTYDCRVFGQLFHAGREIASAPDATMPVAYSASDSPNERFHVVPRAMSRAFIAELVDCYAKAAARMIEAGLDGCEVLASHGYLLAQFFNPRVNRRTDQYGGSLENRLRFAVEIAQAVRPHLGGRPLGMRISGAENGMADGLGAEETLDLCAALEPHFDYFNVTIGGSTSLGGSLHIAPSMFYEPGYVGPTAGVVRKKLNRPVFVAGRINHPDIAERTLASGQADMCAMTRGMIADPEIANKAREGRVDEIRACIACNQACIGHNHKGLSVSCIQFPESGRELQYGVIPPAAKRRKILIAGGGPGGLKAAAVAAARGHDVTLYEREARLGGQVRLAEKLPGRAEFGGIIENLSREAERAGARIVLKTTVDAALVRREAPDAVIIATGAMPRALDLEGGTEGAHVVNSWQVLTGQANVGGSVVIADWRCDWSGLGLAEMLARDGRRVRLCVNGYMPGETIQQYVRDGWWGKIQKLGVEVIPLVRLVGADSDSVYFQHTTNGETIVCENTETLVTSLAPESDLTLEEALEGIAAEIHIIGDCLTPRSAEEAVFDALKVAVKL